MQLLLFLSALLAGLTGAFSGDRAVRVGGQHSEAAISRAAETVAEIASSIVQRRIDAPRISAPAQTSAFAVAPAPIALAVHVTMGRRLE